MAAFVAKSLQVVPLNGPILFELRDGSLVRIALGPYGKGVTVVPIPSKPPSKPKHPRGPTGGPRGRKPRPSTLALREKLAHDKKTAKLRDPPTYAKWLIEQDEEIGLPMARTVVYRELKKFR
ncbi:MAG: hypothetical protein ACYC2H_00250 [Thermoplasmatota archaeon]